MAGIMKILYTLKKEFLLITRDIHAVTVLFVMPAVFIMIMSLAMRDLFELHNTVSIDVLSVNRDAGTSSGAFLKAVGELRTFKFHPLAKDAATEALKEQMLSRDYKFALIIRENFSAFVEGGGGGKGEKPLELLVNPSVTAQTQMLLSGALEATTARLRRDVLVDRLGSVLEAAGIDKKKLTADDESPVEVRYAYRGMQAFKVPSAVQQSVPAWHRQERATLSLCWRHCRARTPCTDDEYHQWGCAC
jgi:ABC-2 type transport system permease protein